MTIGAIRTREVITAGRDSSAAEAARLMRKGHVGDVVVVEEQDGRLIPCGIVTDRDIVVGVVAKGLDPEMIVVGDIMAPEVTVGRERDGVAHTIDVMREKGIRRLPIVDSSGGAGRHRLHRRLVRFPGDGAGRLGQGERA